MAGPTRVGAIDIGTNTVLLLVADAGAAGPVARVERATITRLGQGVDRTGSLSAEAIARTTACLEVYATILHEYGARHVDVVCTSAARDADNGDVFLDAAERALGIRPRIIGGIEEARLTFAGALTGLAVGGPVTVFDVGGGSTEIIRGHSRDRAGIDASVSLDVGSVRLTERHIPDDPPTDLQLEAVRQDVAHALSGVPWLAATPLVGVAGTVTTLSAIDQALPDYDPARVHGAVLTRAAVERAFERLRHLSLPARRQVTGLEPARADVILAGTLLVLGLLDWASTDRLIVSDRGVRWGLARAALTSG